MLRHLASLDLFSLPVTHGTIIQIALTDMLLFIQMLANSRQCADRLVTALQTSFQSSSAATKRD